jgi:hypothetical protein
MKTALCFDFCEIIIIIIIIIRKCLMATSAAHRRRWIWGKGAFLTQVQISAVAVRFYLSHTFLGSCGLFFGTYYGATCLSVHFQTQQQYRHNFCTHTLIARFSQKPVWATWHFVLHHSVINKTSKAAMRSCTVATTLVPFCVESDVLYGDKSTR